VNKVQEAAEAAALAAKAQQLKDAAAVSVLYIVRCCNLRTRVL
jgi:hypothetical protein